MTSNAAPRPRRRFLRFSLRTLLIGMTVVGFGLGWLGWKFQRARKQQQAVAWVQQSGGTVRYDYQLEPDWLPKLFGIDFFCNVKFVHLEGTEVSDLTPLAGLKELETLYLEGTQVSDLAPLAGLKELQTLDLRGTPVSDLAPLAGLDGVNIWLDKNQQVTIPAELEEWVIRFRSPRLPTNWF